MIVMTLGKGYDLLKNREKVVVKIGVDATKLTNAESVCIYSLETFSKSSVIGLVGAVMGSDGHEDMRRTAIYFFKEVKDLASHPIIETDIGNVTIEVRLGGDLCNLLAQLGLCSAGSNHPCPACTLNKKNFGPAAVNANLAEHCNSKLFRTRGNIMNECVKTKPQFNVKTFPLTPLPLNPSAPILDVMIICMLHARMRLAGMLLLKYANK